VFHALAPRLSDRVMMAMIEHPHKIANAMRDIDIAIPSLSTRLSVTRWNCVITVKPIVEILSPTE